jgi:hypothetical protein
VEFRRWHGPPEKGRTFSRDWRGTSIRKQMPSETPRWLVIPERDLFTGIAIVGGAALNWTLLVIDHLNPSFFKLRIGKTGR